MCPSIIIVLISPSRMSMSWSAARSICEYCLAAPTRVEMRVTESSISSISCSVSSAYATQWIPSGSSSGGMVSATSSSQSAFTPAATNAGARSQPLATS